MLIFESYKNPSAIEGLPLSFPIKGGYVGRKDTIFFEPDKTFSKKCVTVTGLTAGKTLNVYTATGSLVYQNMATSDEADIPLTVQGVYIVLHDEHTVKIAY